jgi:hypothetical protein
VLTMSCGERGRRIRCCGPTPQSSTWSTGSRGRVCPAQAKPRSGGKSSGRCLESRAANAQLPIRMRSE